MATRSSRRKNSILRLLFAAAVVTAVNAVDHIVTVGKAAHRFSPEQLTAAIGDTIVFEFYPKNHSVVRGSWEQPCIPYEKIEPQVKGFFSGFRPVMTIEADPPTFRVLVNDTNPMFFYCSALDSCNVWGMAGVINPREDTPIAGYQAEAKKPGTFVLQPGQDWPSEAENSRTPEAPSMVPTGGSGLPSSTSPSIQTVTAIPVAAATSAPLSTGGIAGVTLGSIGVIVLICGLFFYLGRRRTHSRSSSRDSSTPHHSIIYEKGHPVSYIAPPVRSPLPEQPPISPLYGDQMGYRNYPPDPRAFPPGVLADDKMYRRSTGPIVEIGSPTTGWGDSRAHSYIGGHNSPAPQSETGEQTYRGPGPDSVTREG